MPTRKSTKNVISACHGQKNGMKDECLRERQQHLEDGLDDCGRQKAYGALTRVRGAGKRGWGACASTRGR
jgi:hypothetical protein